MAHSYKPAGASDVGYSGGTVTSSGLSEAGLTATQKKELDALVAAGILVTDRPGGGLSGSVDHFSLNGNIAALGTAQVVEDVCPQDGTLVQMLAESTATSDAAAVVTLKNITQSKTCGTITFPSGYTAHTKLASANLTFTTWNQGDVFSVETDGGGTSAAPATVEITLKK